MQSLSTKWAPLAVSVIVAITFGAVLVLLLTRAIPNADTNLMQMLVGVLSAKFGDVVAFWLGSSAGSKAKDDVIAANTNRPPPSQTP